MNQDAYMAGLNSVKNYKKSNLGRNSLIGVSVAGILGLGTLIYNNSNEISENVSEITSGTIYALNPKNHLPTPEELFNQVGKAPSNGNISNNESLDSKLNPSLSTSSEVLDGTNTIPTVNLSNYNICKQAPFTLDTEISTLEKALNNGFESAYGEKTDCDFTNNWYTESERLFTDLKSKGIITQDYLEKIATKVNGINSSLK